MSLPVQSKAKPLNCAERTLSSQNTSGFCLQYNANQLHTPSKMSICALKMSNSRMLAEYIEHQCSLVIQKIYFSKELFSKYFHPLLLCINQTVSCDILLLREMFKKKYSIQVKNPIIITRESQSSSRLELRTEVKEPLLLQTNTAPQTIE